VPGSLPVEQAFAAFGSDVVIMMMGLPILMSALDRTGVTDFPGRASQPAGLQARSISVFRFPQGR
jgi:hypothetical protein